MPYARKDTLTWELGRYYHIYNRGARRVTIFREATNFLFVTSQMKKYSKVNKTSVIAYCLMPNHYHFLLRQDGEKPAGGLAQSVFNSYSKAYNKKYSHSGTLFEGRFLAQVIQKNSHLINLCIYIHVNPVKDGLVASPEDWPYSNYLEWIGERDGTLFDLEFVRENFGSPADYKALVMDYLKTRYIPEDVRKYLQSLEK